MADDDTLKLPKKIAGVKVPKFLRRPGTFRDLLDSPVGRAVLAEALLAAAAALKDYKPAVEPADRTGEPGGDAAPAESAAADDLSGNGDLGPAGPRPGRRKARRDKIAAGPSTH